jgi:2-polyprenyl-3-methyl-5-hydroxy-6-metoxy-1,4-benzoquinol methylase
MQMKLNRESVLNSEKIGPDSYSVLDENRINYGESSLRDMLEVESLEGKTFLDIGSGSGLLSLAARRLGATVHSFDYDPKSVACTKELRHRYFPDDPNWHVETGPALDEEYLKSLGQWDVVYSWGVLHHIGAMWQALENVAPLVTRGGQLFVAIYNDQGGWSHRWRLLKRIYNQVAEYYSATVRIFGYGPARIEIFCACLPVGLGFILTT